MSHCVVLHADWIHIVGGIMAVLIVLMVIAAIVGAVLGYFCYKKRELNGNPEQEGGLG